MKISYLKQYEFDYGRIISINSRLKIYDGKFCISNAYNTLAEAEEALKKYVLETLGFEYDTRIEI